MTSALPSGLNSIDFSNRGSMKNNIIDQGRSTLESAMQIHTTKSGIPLPVEQKKKNVKVNIVVSNIEPDFEGYDLDVDNDNNKKKSKSKDKKNVKNKKKNQNLTPSKIKKNKSPDHNINNSNLNQNENQDSKKQKKKVIKKVIKKVPKQNNPNTINNIIPYSSTSEIPKQTNLEFQKNNNPNNINQIINKPIKNKNITNNNNKVCMICKGLPVRPQECINCKRQICTICTYELNKNGICNECGGRIEPINKGINNNNNITFESNITRFQPKSNIIGERNKYSSLNAKEFYEQNKDRFMNDTWKDENYNPSNYNTNVNNSDIIGKNNLMLDCEICGKKFNNENEKLNHMKSEHDDDNNLNNFNFKKFNKNKKNRKVNRQQSVGSINLYECKYCNKSFGNKITRAAHIKNIHGEDDDDENINKDNKDINKKRLSFDDNSNNEKKRKRIGSWSQKYPCDLCEKEFDTLNGLEYHIKNTHNQKLSDKNNLKNSNDKDNIKDNNSKKNIIEKYNNIDFYPCDYCSKVYNDLEQLKQHTNDNHGKEFDNDKYLNNIKNIKSGKNSEQYPCDNCNKIFNNLNTLIQHNNIEHNINKDDDLNKLNSNKDEDLNKLNSNEDEKNIPNSKYGLNNIYPCEYCNKVYNNFNTLTNHIKNEHGKLNIPRNSSSNQIIIGPNEFYCRFCLKNFPSLNKRDNHILSIHNITPYDEDKYIPLHYSKDIDVNSNNNYFCRHCNKVFPSKNERDSHLKNNHLINENVINENVQYILDKKPKEIINEEELFYNNRRRYDLECKYCLRPFNSLNNLYQHMYEMHHIPINKNEENLPSNLEKEYECKHCNKKYDNLNSINQHLKTAHHINDNLNENEIQKSNHIKYLTKDLDDYFYCDTCGQVFNYRPNLINHLKEIHNIYKTNNNNNTKISYKSDDEGNYDSIKRKLNENEYDNNKNNNKYKGINYSNGKYQCNYCKKSYLNNEKCENHIKRHHYYPDYHPKNPTTIMQGIKQKKGQYECDYCNKIYNYYNDCVKHIYRHHLNDNNKIEEIPKNLIKGCLFNNGKFECNYCNKIYIHYNDCEKHIMKHHSNNDNNIFGNTNNFSGNSNFSRVKRSDIYNCFFCKQILKSKIIYLNHLKDYHKIEFDDNYQLYDSCDKTSYRIQTEFLK